MAPPLRLVGIAMLLVLVSDLAAVPQAGRGLVEGVVVRLGSGEPITSVNVEMRRVEGTATAPLGPAVVPQGAFSSGAVVVPSSPNPSDIFRARTGDDGRFVFTNLKPGKYRLLAAHPRGTYYPAEYGQRHPRGPGYDFVFDETQPMKVRLEMAPMASVSGRVLGEDGRPAPHTHVMAAEVSYQNGQRVLNQVQGVETDDRGEYRLFWLPPGQYYIGAFPEGLRRRTSTAPFGPPGAVASLNQTYPQPFIHYRNSGGEIVEEVYETVYAAGEINLQLARLLDLRLGSNVNGVDISLAAGRRRAARVRGVVIDGATSKPASNVSVRMVRRALAPVIFSPAATTDANGAFEISGLMPGSYIAVATGDPRSNAPISTAQPIEIGGSNLDGLRLVITPGFSLSGRIKLDDRPAEGYRIGLVPEVLGLPAPRFNALPSGSFTMNGTHPGNYRVIVTSPDATNYVKSIRVAGLDVPDGEVRIADGPPGDLEIALGRNGGVVDGQVTDAQQTRPANVFVVLIPSNTRRPDLFKTARTDMAGRFRIQGVTPGSYLAFAWPWLPDGIWQYPEFIRTFEARGKPVNVVEGANGNLELVLLPELNF
jgi:hypothetical protein